MTIREKVLIKSFIVFLIFCVLLLVWVYSYDATKTDGYSLTDVEVTKLDNGCFFDGCCGGCYKEGFGTPMCIACTNKKIPAKAVKCVKSGNGCRLIYPGKTFSIINTVLSGIQSDLNKKMFK